MGTSRTLYHGLIKPNIGQEKDQWGVDLNSNFDTIDHLLTIGQSKVLNWSFPYVSVGTTYSLLGFDFPKVTASALNSGAPIATTFGCSRVRIDINTGSDLVGSLTITGTSRHTVTGATTADDTEVITINGAGTYVSAKYWTGALTVSTTTLTITSLDLHQISWYDNRGRRFAVLGLSHQAQTRAVGTASIVSLVHAKKDGSILTLTEKLGGLLNVTGAVGAETHWEKELEISNLDVSGRDEGIICTVATTVGTAGDLRDLRLELHYENRTTE